LNHDDTQKLEYRTPFFLYLGTTWMWANSFSFRQLHTGGQNLKNSLGELHGRFGRWKDEETPSLYRLFNPDNPARSKQLSLLTYPPSYLKNCISRN
jgi:hypothetical protein